MRYLHGWVPLRQATVSGTYTLDAVTENTDNAVIKIQSPMSDSEFFCVEYRKQKTENVVAGLGIETKIPASGLLIYRVNNAVENHTNAAGSDYLYVFRPNDTSTSASAGTLSDAAVSPDKGETSYGSADFNAKLTDNTIFYSSGKNSGIVISNIAYTNNGKSITFDVTYPDYTSLDLWDKLGSTFGSSITSNTEMAFDGNNIYVAALQATDWSYNAKVFKWNGTSWTDLGGTFTDAYDQKIAVFNGTVYLTYCNGSGNPVLWKYTGGKWTKITTVTSASYPMSLNFFADKNNLYLTFAQDSNKIVIDKVTASGLTTVDNTLTASESFSNYAVASYNGKFYAVYSYFGWNLTDKNTYVSEYDTAAKTWKKVQTLSIANANIHNVVVRDGKLYIASGVSGKYPVYVQFNGETWTSEEAKISTTSYSGMKLDAAGETPYIMYLTNDSVKIDKRGENGWENISEVTGDCSYFNFVLRDGIAYVPAVSNGNSNISVFNKRLYVEPINITGASGKVAVGLSMKLTATGGVGTYTWQSENEKMLTISADGTVTGVRQGGTTVKVTDEQGNAATYFVKVTPNNGTVNVYVVGGSQYLKIDWWKKYSEARIKLAFEEYNCENAVTYKWTSSNSMVKVDTNGNVTNYGFIAHSSVITLTAFDADRNIVAKDSIKVLFYKFSSQKDRYI